MQMGDKMRDMISGYEGIATGRTAYMNGCVKWLLERELDKDGKEQSCWFDEQRLNVIESKAFTLPSQTAERAATGGGPMLLAPRP